MCTREKYNLYKQAGICVRCGTNPAKENRVMCSSCLEKERIRVAETRKALTNMGFCPRCGRNKLFGDEKMCLECKEEMYEYNKKHKSHIKINYNKKRKESGLCIKCGKRKPVNGKTKCAFCAEKERNRAREYRIQKGIDVDRTERQSRGLCYICGLKISNGKLCENCKENVTRNLRNSSGDNPWKKDNKILFGGNQNERICY